MIASVRQGLEDIFPCRWFINMVSLLLMLQKYPQAMGRIQPHWAVPGYSVYPKIHFYVKNYITITNFAS